MNIIEAAKAMQEGKRVRRAVWEYGWLERHGARVVDENGGSSPLFLTLLLADDWQIVEERHG